MNKIIFLLLFLSISLPIYAAPAKIRCVGQQNNTMLGNGSATVAKTSTANTNFCIITSANPQLTGGITLVVVN